MALVYTYTDSYLASLITIDRENQALADVDLLGTFPAAWRKKLAIVRAYIITCMESQKSTEDVFTAKLAAYRNEFAEALPQARAAAQLAAATSTNANQGASPFTVSLERA